MKIFVVLASVAALASSKNLKIDQIEYDFCCEYKWSILYLQRKEWNLSVLSRNSFILSLSILLICSWRRAARDN